MAKQYVPQDLAEHSKKSEQFSTYSLLETQHQVPQSHRRREADKSKYAKGGGFRGRGHYHRGRRYHSQHTSGPIGIDISQTEPHVHTRHSHNDDTNPNEKKSHANSLRKLPFKRKVSSDSRHTFSQEKFTGGERIHSKDSSDSSRTLQSQSPRDSQDNQSHTKPHIKQNTSYGQPSAVTKSNTKSALEKERWNIQSLPMGELKSLCRLGTRELVDQLYSRIKPFQRTLQLSNKLEQADIMDAIIYILQKVSQSLKSGQSDHSRACQILGEALSSRCAPFRVRLSVYVQHDIYAERTPQKHPPMIPNAFCSPDAKIATICSLFSNLLESIPDTSWAILPVDELANFIRGSPDHCHFVSRVENIVMLRDEMCDQLQAQAVKEHSTECDWDNSEYRELPILPTSDEVCIPDPPARLRANIVSGCYTDWMHYYDIQFRLLREDFIAPLRRGVCDYIQGARGRKLQDVKVYHNVNIVTPMFTREGITYEITFDISRLKRCKWEHSKRLLYGSLLCLSPDNFTKIVFFATVSNRDPEKLKEGKIQVRFEDGTQMIAFCRQQTIVRFIMVESLAYFEASRHILRSLQTAEVATMPFTQYLIENECDDVSPAKYLTDQQFQYAEYDLTCLLKKQSSPSDSCSPLFQPKFQVGSKVLDDDDSGSEKLETDSNSSDSSDICSLLLGHPRQLKFNILDKNQWHSHDNVELDESQLQAIQMALTQEIAVIQGPPGTGKTYVGLKIVDALLKNRDCWDSAKQSPILVMCYTNHALDQFLEGILKQSTTKKPRIVRVGGRSKSELIQQYNIEKVRRRVYVPNTTYGDIRQLEKLIDDTAKEIIRQLQVLSHSRTFFLNVPQLYGDPPVISPLHFYQLFEKVETPEERQWALELWLGTHKAHYEQIVINPESSNEQVTQSTTLNKNEADPSTKDQNPQQSSTQPTPENEDKDTVTVDNKKQQSTELDKHEDEEDNEAVQELIDVHGEASIEQEARIMEEEDYFVHRFHYSNYDSSEESDSEKSVKHGDQDQNEDDKIVHNKEDMFRDTNYSDSESENDSTNDVTKSQQIDEPLYTQICRVLPKVNAHNVVTSGRCQVPMTEEEVQDVTNIALLNQVQRWRLYNFWITEYFRRLEEQIEMDFEKYNQLCKDRLEARRQADRFALETAEVIGMTTTGAAKYQHILHLVKPRIVIVEEAAEVLESHIVSALNAGTQHLILIGDHKQLRPKPNDYTLAKKYRLDISLFERLVRNNFPHATLQIQHRMRPEIAQLVKPHIYKTLLNHSTVEEYDNVTGIEKNLFFIQHDHPEAEDENLLSHSNQHEARYLAALCKYLLQQGYKPSQITVLVTYSGQLLKIRAEMPKAQFYGICVCTVDNFQGEENDIILLSLVRSNEESKVGFLKEENRVCVALSRAKKGFYCIGNIKMLRENAPIWEVIMSDMEKKGYLGNGLPLGCTNHPSTKFTACVSEDFRRNAPEGGCQRDCDFRLSCGHACARKCHTSDPNHDNYQCTKPCKREMPKCGHEQIMKCYEKPSFVDCRNPCKNICPNGHQCPLRCYMGCKPCEIIVDKKLPRCGHTQSMFCYKDPNTFKCKASCDKTCDRGHPCTKPCSEDCGKCEVQVMKTIAECKHTMELPCYKQALHVNCTEPCEKILFCGHACKKKCGEICNRWACNVNVEVQLYCKHSKKVQCNQRYNDIVCEKPCEKVLPCKHMCSMKCSEPCTTQCEKIVNKEWPCGHKLKRKCFQTKNPEEYPCEKPCTNTLSCGHPCPGKCGDECGKQICHVPVEKKYPCGHKYTISCSSSSADRPCKARCTVTLACGHRCEGQCSQCFSTRLHQPCKFGVELKHFCGHSYHVPCLDLLDRHPKKINQCVAFCPHKKCSHDCSTQCTPCTEPCQWSCPHHTCTKLCHEICDRPPCDERCVNRLKCGHQCFGVCGEPCLSVCPDCQRKVFNKKFIGTGSQGFNRDMLYVQLPCEHIFSVEYMDSYASEHHKVGVSGTLVSPLQCPRCKNGIFSSFRYGNVMKHSLRDINAVRDIIASKRLSNEISESPVYGEWLFRARLNNLLWYERKLVEQRNSYDLPFLTEKQIKKGGWSFLQHHKSGPICRYKPFPPITEFLKKLLEHLKLETHVSTAQEMYIQWMVWHTIELLNTSFLNDLKSVPLAEIEYNRDVSRQLSTFVNYLSWLWKERGSRLSTQLMNDLRSELYRLCLLVQYCLIKADDALTKESEVDSLDEVEEFLRQYTRDNSSHVSQSDFITHAVSLNKRYMRSKGQSIPVNYEHVAHTEEKTRPLVVKGNWWKCPQGHYYCTPVSMNSNVQEVCTQCA